jgi:hypothetical protein
MRIHSEKRKRILTVYSEKELRHRVLKAIGVEKWRNCSRKS